MCVKRRYAMYIQVFGGSLVQDRDSYWRVKFLMNVRTASAANLPASDFSRRAMSIVRNIRERNVAKSISRRAGKCFGLIEIDPVSGSITMLWSVASDPPATTMPFVDPGAARYWSRFGSGV